jgi:ubiquinone/menaquinone biosynthesis C-methylase UbiE
MGRGHRFFAAFYDRLAGLLEPKGLSELRKDVVGDARGRVVEIGAGTGLNFSQYGEGVSEVIATEPDPHMLKRARPKAAGGRVPIRVEQAPAERLPVEDASVDTVVSTYVLCTVPDPSVALAEIRRILKPDGRLLFLEHVRAPGPRLARWQDRLERPWRFFGGGCHPNRDTAANIERAGFTFERLDRFLFTPEPQLVRPQIKGMARPAAS